jgi:Ca2+-transporting ATPase
VVFSLFNIAIGLSARSETHSALSRDVLQDRRQLGLFGLAFLLTVLPTELGFLANRFELTSIAGDNRWLICIGMAIGLLLIDEVIKFFLRRRQSHAAAQPESPAPLAASAGS